MNTLKYIEDQLWKARNKRHESYVINRFWNRLDKTDVKIITQQYVTRPDGHALTDMYLPQFDIHLEVDEPHHLDQQEQDQNRDRDIIDATDHEIVRIPITNNIEDINNQVDDLVERVILLRSSMIENGTWQPWDVKREYNPVYWRRIGELRVDMKPSFLKIIDTLNCCGEPHEDVKGGGWFKSETYPGHFHWYPKLYAHDNWDNALIENGTIIREKNTDPVGAEANFKRVSKNQVKRIVWAKYKDNLNNIFYRFVGVFEFDEVNSSVENGNIYRRVSSNLVL